MAHASIITVPGAHTGSLPAADGHDARAIRSCHMGDTGRVAVGGRAR
jgi:hypothetical protein